jgi:hypothetical protein
MDSRASPAILSYFSSSESFFSLFALLNDLLVVPPLDRSDEGMMGDGIVKPLLVNLRALLDV